MRNSKVAGLASIVLLAVLVGVSSPAQAGQGSATTSSSDTSKHPSCNGQAIDLTAPVISRHDVLIMAPVAKVWAAHIDLAAWPSWNRHVAYIKRLDDGAVL